jgi:predicted N-acyltransferase
MRAAASRVTFLTPMSDPLPLKLRVHRSIEEVSREAWDALLDEQSIPFLEWKWLWALEESKSAVPREGWHPRHFTLWRGNRLIAAAPAYLRDDSYGEFVYDWSWASAAERAGLKYYPKLILAVPMTPGTGRRVLVAPGEDRPARVRELLQGALEFARSERVSSLHVNFPTRDEWEILGELGFAQRLGVQYHWFNQGYANYDAFLDRFRSKRRNQLKRERRGPAEQGITLTTLRGDALSGADPKAVHGIYASTVDKHMWGKRLLTPKFFELVLEHFRHRVEFVEARKDGRLVAGAFNLSSPQAIYGRYWGCLEEFPFLHFNVCLYHPVEECIRLGLSRFEPGAGGEHKLVRGFEPAVTYSGHWIFHPGFDRAIRDFVSQERRAIEEGLPKWRAETGFRG